MQSKSIKSFTFIESLLIILILTILLNATLRVNVFNNISLSDDIKATQFVNQLEYFKSKAMRNHQSITLLISKHSSIIKVIEAHDGRYNYNIEDGKIVEVKNLGKITFNKEGRTNQFGSLILKINQHQYKLIINIEKGRIRYFKI
ncbi:competence protein [Staphylococcus hominis]|uniref:competence type IV pilus minor pilin ComGD n=1 Tax=Staphylococcus hominis TaxID=1290 RepID=UPI000D1F6100|nr:competence type IV pilus minor pilin ComGD [Staphylococcus hominis]MCE4949633.1 competence protein [Staphylococcus hominis]MCE4951393.1 competence protein [Staphylococcus hominis]MCE4975072.1 competence protein [Staphylococcus hominis]PTK19905.1 competence protein [Staphylococcus hominis]PTK24135.1 competence protein [Staphylococcus hominis]